MVPHPYLPASCENDPPALSQTFLSSSTLCLCMDTPWAKDGPTLRPRAPINARRTAKFRTAASKHGAAPRTLSVQPFYIVVHLIRATGLQSRKLNACMISIRPYNADRCAHRVELLQLKF